MPLAAALTVACGLGGAAWGGYRFVTTSPRFAIDRIEIRGNEQVPTAALLAALPVRTGDNSFGVDQVAIERAMRTNPWIASATVERELPHTLIVTVTERQPIAVAAITSNQVRSSSNTQDGHLYLVDTTGHPFKRAAIEAGEGAGLPVVTGLSREAYREGPDTTARSIRTILDVLESWSAVESRPAIGEAHIDPTGALVLRTFEHAAAIYLGPLDGDPAARMEIFDATWRELSESERASVTAVRLDARTDHVTLAFTGLK